MRYVLSISLILAALLVTACMGVAQSGILPPVQSRFLAAPATDEKFDGPGDEAVLVAEGLKVESVTDQIAVMADQIAFWPDDENPTHLVVGIEQWPDRFPTAETRESVQLVELKTGKVTTVLYGLMANDGVRVTPWGTILITEEQSDGQAWEILNPLDVTEAFADRTTGESDNPNVVYRPALGNFAWEGSAVLPDGTVYAGDELKPKGDADGGTIYKFVPAKPLAEGARVTTPEESPLAAGKLYALSLGAKGEGPKRDYGQGTQTGRGMWIEIPDPSQARALANELGATGYYRPEDMVLDPLALAEGIVRVYWANTGNSKGAYYGEVMVMVDENDGQTPNVQYFMLGDGAIAQPDNVAIHPVTGDLYVIEDFSHGDVWVCKKDGPDPGEYTEGCHRILSVRDPKSEPTGFIVAADGDTAYLDLQHRDGMKNETEGRQHDDLIRITGLNALLP